MITENGIIELTAAEAIYLTSKFIIKLPDNEKALLVAQQDENFKISK